MDDSPSTPKHMTKLEFGRRLYQLMIGRGWHQSELARRAGLNRDSISTYIRGSSLPTPLNLQKLAAAFDMAPEALLPNHLEAAIDDDPAPAFAMEACTAQKDKDMVWVRVNRMMPFSAGLKIAEIISGLNEK